MISWLQRNFQQHYRTVFMVLLAIVIVTFVFTIGNMPGLGRGERTARNLKVFGVPYSTEAEQRELMDRGRISFLLNYGFSYYDPRQIELHAYQRAAGLQLADKLGVPDPTPELLTEQIRNSPLFRGPNGTYDPQQYARILDNLASGPPGERERFGRVLAEDWRIAQVTRAVAGPGYVLDSEVTQNLARADTKWSVQSATLDLTKIQAAGEPAEETLRQYFEANSIRYQTPERVRVSYVKFPAADFVERAQVTDEDVQRYFNQNIAKYRTPAPPPAEGQPPAPPAEPKLEDVREQVVRDATMVRARNLAANAGADLTVAVFNNEIKRGTPAFEQLLEKQHVKLELPAAFTAEQAPPGTNWSQNVLTTAFRLNDSRWVSDPLMVDDGAIVLFYEEKLPPAIPSFSEVRDRVLADVREDERRRAITARGVELQRQLADAVKGGQSFADAAKAAGLETKSWEDFTLRTRPGDIDPGVLSRLEDLTVGAVSDMAVQGDRGTFTFLAAREAPDMTATSEHFTEMRSMMMAQNAQIAEQGVFGEIVEKELLATGIAKPRE